MTPQTANPKGHVDARATEVLLDPVAATAPQPIGPKRRHPFVEWLAKLAHVSRGFAGPGNTGGMSGLGGSGGGGGLG